MGSWGSRDGLLDIRTSTQAVHRQSTRQSWKHPVADNGDVDVTVHRSWWPTTMIRIMMTVLEAMMMLMM